MRKFTLFIFILFVGCTQPKSNEISQREISLTNPEFVMGNAEDIGFLDKKTKPMSKESLIKMQEILSFFKKNHINSTPQSAYELYLAQTLSIQSDSLTELIDEFDLLINLKKLELFTPKLTTLPNSLSQALNLKELVIKQANLSLKDKDFSSLQNLKVLRLSGKISAQWHKQPKLKSLKILDLSGAFITDSSLQATPQFSRYSLPPKSFYSFLAKNQTITNLILDSPNFTLIADEICKLTNLQLLSAPHATNLPKCLRKMRNLKLTTSK